MSTHQYVSFTTDFFQTPWLGKLPLSSKDPPVCYDVSKYVPPNATEILIYIFVTVREAKGPLRRSVYDVYTQDMAGRHYSQLMNMVFTKDDDFVMNSANLWLPLHEQKFYIRLPGEWTIPEPRLPQSQKTYKNLAEAMKAFTTGTDDIFTDVFLLGYRN